MLPNDRIRILHMIEAAETAQGFVLGRSREDFQTDRLLVLAIERAIEIIGEAATKVSVETRLSAPTIPWHLIAGMRNRLIHVYFDVDTNVLWRTATEELPPLVSQLRELLGGP